MKTILKIAAASALFSIAGSAAAEPAAQDHASHKHAAPPAPAGALTPAPTPSPSATPAAMNCEHMKQSGAPMAGMSGMQGMAGMDGKPMDHQNMMGGDMKGCEHMMHGTAMPMAPASPAPAHPPKP